jgi:thyrotropin-releasing hormone receptor
VTNDVIIRRCRYIAIVHPIRAHMVCARNRILAALAIVWPASFLCGLPTVIFNTVQHIPGVLPDHVQLCILVFPGDHKTLFAVFKLLEFLLFFFVPVVVQVCLHATTQGLYNSYRLGTAVVTSTGTCN